MAKVALTRFGCAKQSKNLEWYLVFTLACKNNIGTDTWPIIWSETNPAVSSVSLFVKNQSAKGPGKHFQILNLGCNLKASWILLKGDSKHRKKILITVVIR